MKKFNIIRVSLPFLLIIMVLIFPVQASIHLPPRMIKSPEDIVFEIGTTGNQLVWQFEAEESQDSPSTYDIKVNGSLLVEKVSWQDNVDIILNVDDFSLGIHIVQIQVNDTGVDSGAAPPAIDEAKVTVVEEGMLPTSEANNTETTNFPFVVLVLTGVTIVLINRKRKKQ